MLRITLVRHGETAWNAAQRCQGVTDVPLNATGRAQAEAAAEALRRFPPDAVYSSDLERARHTAECIAAPHGLAVRARPGLREMHQGELEGRTFTDLLRDYGDLMQQWGTAPADLVMPGGGESLRQVQTRVCGVLDAIVAAHDRGHVVVVSHTLALRTLVAHVLNLPLDQCRRFHIDTAALTRLEVNGRLPGLALRTLNDTAHLHALGERDA